jgi:hypothetical protein
MRGIVTPDYLAVLHHESNAVEFANVDGRISRNGDEIGELS